MAHPVTILDLRDSPWVDGPGRTILDCAETIDRNRYRIVIGAFDGGRENSSAYETEARERGLTVTRIREQGAWDPNVYRQVVASCREHGAALVHSHDFRSDVFGFLVSRKLGIPWVATAHGWIQNDWRGELKSRMDRLLLRQANHVIAVSNQTRARLGRLGDGARCSVVPNALRVDRYHPNRCAGPFRKEHRVSDQELLIANIGRLSPEKGQVPFIEAAAELIRENPVMKFALMGSGPEESRLRQLVSDLGISDYVIFAGYREDMGTVYNELDLVVQSSFTEGMPNVVLEALLMGLPVIATNVGGTREVLKDGETGVLINTGSAEIVSAIRRFLNDRDGFARLARNGRQDVLARFDHAKRVAELSLIYDRALSGRELP